MDIVFGFAEWVTVVCELGYVGLCTEYIEAVGIGSYCMKPPNMKAPKCTLLSIQCFIIQGQRSQELAGLATAHCEHRWGQLTLESPFRIVESG